MFPLFTTRCLHVRHGMRNPSGGSGNCGRECCPVILPKWRLPRHLGIFYMPQIYDMEPTALLPLRRKACWGFFRSRHYEAIIWYTTVFDCFEFFRYNHKVSHRSRLLGAFAKSRKASIRFIMSVRPSVLPHRKTRVPQDGFSLNLIFGYFWKISRENSSSIKMWQE